MTTAGAVQANRTREERAAIALLRGGHFAGSEKNVVRDQVLDFLQPYMGPEDAMGDLLGPGWSALAAIKRGMRVIAAEDLSFTGRVLGSKDLARRTAMRMGADEGYEVSIGPFSKIIPSLTTAFYDPCGPPTALWEADIRAMASSGVLAFAATCLLSRVDGARGIGEEGYIRLARMAIEDAAPAYDVLKVIQYRGESNLPMAVVLVEHESAALRSAARRIVERTRREQGLPEKLEDPEIIRKVATLFRTAKPRTTTVRSTCAAGAWRGTPPQRWTRPCDAPIHRWPCPAFYRALGEQFEGAHPSKSQIGEWFPGVEGRRPKSPKEFASAIMAHPIAGDWLASWHIALRHDVEDRPMSRQMAGSLRREALHRGFVSKTTWADRL